MASLLYQAHRGVQAAYPENTEASVRAAIRQGYGIIEIDPAVTRDGVFVLLHDKTINRTARDVAGNPPAAEKLALHELTYAEASAYEYGGWFSPAFRGEKLPLLSDILALAREEGVRLKIDMKYRTFTPEEFAAFADLFAYGADNITFNCPDGDLSYAREWRRRYPACTIGFDGVTDEEVLIRLHEEFGSGVEYWIPLNTPTTAAWWKRAFLTPEIAARVSRYGRLCAWLLDTPSQLDEVLSYTTPYAIETTGRIKPRRTTPESLGIRIHDADAEGHFPAFCTGQTGKRVLAVADGNTEPFLPRITGELTMHGADVQTLIFPTRALVPDDEIVTRVTHEVKKRQADYLLAVGSGSLNDVCKFVSDRAGIPCGVLPTACSMDGYVSRGAALMEGGKKVTETVHTPSDVLVDPAVLMTAPAEMTAAGFGDILGKYTCLADWRLAHLLRGEAIDREAYTRMEEARDACMAALPAITRRDAAAMRTLMDALLTAGLAMAIAGNSRPASGSEHHISHYIETDCVARGVPIPPHGIKVGIGAMISAEIYRYLATERPPLPVPPLDAEAVYRLAAGVPTPESLREKLTQVGCPLRLSEIGVSRALAERTIREAYTMRDRYTVLTLMHEAGLTDRLLPLLLDRYA